MAEEINEEREFRKIVRWIEYKQEKTKEFIIDREASLATLYQRFIDGKMSFHHYQENSNIITSLLMDSKYDMMVLNEIKIRMYENHANKDIRRPRQPLKHPTKDFL